MNNVSPLDLDSSLCHNETLIVALEYIFGEKSFAMALITISSKRLFLKLKKKIQTEQRNYIRNYLIWKTKNYIKYINIKA